MKGTWKVLIEVGEENVVVMHKKKECSKSSQPKDQFEFEWNFEITFEGYSKNKQTCVPPKVNLFVTDYGYGPKTSSTVKAHAFESRNEQSCFFFWRI